MKHILLFGAGKSATVLIDYLKEISLKHLIKVTVADGNLELVESKVGIHNMVLAKRANVENETERQQLVKDADVVISLLPPDLHYLVAKDCLAFGKHLLTASYIDARIKAMEPEIKEKGLLFLCEMGLDPGIDHMSAMELIHRIENEGGKINSFKSHCGGLVAPESDDNPWHYKISWNPRNIILAGKAGAIYKEDGEEKTLAYEHLFDENEKVEVPGLMPLAWYANRDSVSYIPLYGLEGADTFIRTTLRHPEFCFGWKNIIDLKLTNEKALYDTSGMTVAGFFKAHFVQFGFSNWLNEMLSTRLEAAHKIMDKIAHLEESETDPRDPEEKLMVVNELGELSAYDVNEIKLKASEMMAQKLYEANLSLKQLLFLGLDSEEPLNLGTCSAADILQNILEKKLALSPADKDMVVMVHEINYRTNGVQKNIKSCLVVKGEDNLRTAMAKTVGLPIGIAAKLIIENKITETGLHIPILPAIYLPVLNELKINGIRFEEYKD